MSLLCAVTVFPEHPRAQDSQTQPTPGPTGSEIPLAFVAPSESGVPDDYLSGVVYLGNFREAWG
ncbi:MAG: hypothetical protein L0191_18495, partial [Acidobacteria bacterium]|nr:hypothetical protein [Acidobacteriota bacterium]